MVSLIFNLLEAVIFGVIWWAALGLLFRGIVRRVDMLMKVLPSDHPLSPDDLKIKNKTITLLVFLAVATCIFLSFTIYLIAIEAKGYNPWSSIGILIGSIIGILDEFSNSKREKWIKEKIKAMNPKEQ